MNDLATRDSIDETIRTRTALHAVPLDRWSFRLADDEGHLEAAFALLHDAYVGRGLQAPGRSRLRVTPQHLLAESLVFVACLDGEVIGTITTTGDSPARLPLDKDYAQPLQRLRRAGARIAEIGSLAVHPDHRSAQLAAAMAFLSISACWHALQATHVVIGVNPSIEAYYRAVWGFEAMGSPQHHADLDAPVVGLLQVRDGLRERFFEHHFRQPRPDERPVAALLDPWPCVEQAAAHRLSRRVFRRLFTERTDALYSLDRQTQRYLTTQRSAETLRPSPPMF